MKVFTPWHQIATKNQYFRSMLGIKKIYYRTIYSMLLLCTQKNTIYSMRTRDSNAI